MFLRYYLRSDLFNMIETLTTCTVLAVAKELKEVHAALQMPNIWTLISRHVSNERNIQTIEQGPIDILDLSIDLLVLSIDILVLSIDFLVLSIDILTNFWLNPKMSLHKEDFSYMSSRNFRLVTLLLVLVHM